MYYKQNLSTIRTSKTIRASITRQPLDGEQYDVFWLDVLLDNKGLRSQPCYLELQAFPKDKENAKHEFAYKYKFLPATPCIIVKLTNHKAPGKAPRLPYIASKETLRSPKNPREFNVVWALWVDVFCSFTLYYYLKPNILAGNLD